MAERKTTNQEILEIIKKHKVENLTVRRMCELVGYTSSSTMQARIQEMKDRGLIKIMRKTTIEVTDRGEKIMHKGKET